MSSSNALYYVIWIGDPLILHVFVLRRGLLFGDKGIVGGAIYGQYPPLANACRKPGEWQTYDIIWEGPRFDGDTLTRPAFVTVLLNGIVLHNRKELRGVTNHRVLTKYSPHDAEGSVAFVVESVGVRLGILTDLGHVFPALLDVFSTLDGAWLESNHDARMLREGPYPAFLQDRIAGPSGHLSNAECVDLVSRAASSRLRFVGLAHLSGACNTPTHALTAMRPLAERNIEILLAPRDAASPPVDLA